MTENNHCQICGSELIKNYDKNHGYVWECPVCADRDKFFEAGSSDLTKFVSSKRHEFFPKTKEKRRGAKKQISTDELLNLLSMSPLSLAEMVEKLGVGKIALRKRLSHLVEQGVIQKERQGRYVKYTCPKTSQENVAQA